jgi:hypothetical protein
VTSPPVPEFWFAPEADMHEGVFVILANSFHTGHRGLKKRQHHGIFRIKLKHGIDVAVIQRSEVFKDCCLYSSSF